MMCSYSEKRVRKKNIYFMDGTKFRTNIWLLLYEITLWWRKQLEAVKKKNKQDTKRWKLPFCGTCALNEITTLMFLIDFPY